MGLYFGKPLLMGMCFFLRATSESTRYTQHYTHAHSPIQEQEGETNSETHTEDQRESYGADGTEQNSRNSADATTL